jgi:hypothetical protein
MRSSILFASKFSIGTIITVECKLRACGFTLAGYMLALPMSSKPSHKEQL